MIYTSGHDKRRKLKTAYCELFKDEINVFEKYSYHDKMCVQTHYISRKHDKIYTPTYSQHNNSKSMKALIPI